MTLSLQLFSERQPLASQFFNRAIQTQHLMHAYTLIGKPTDAMGAFVLALAQIINCSSAQPNTEGWLTACGECQPCRWINQNAHPGVVTLTNLTYEGESATTSRSKAGPQSITVGQLERLQGELSHRSADGFKRIVLIAGADTSLVHATPPQFMAPKDWQPTSATSQDEDNPPMLWLKSLDTKVLPDRVANKFLKTLEEPPSNVIFFLLAAAEDKLLNTIVSRCQRIPFRDWPEPLHIDTQLAQVFEQWSQQLGQDTAFMDLSTQLLDDLSKQFGSMDYILSQYQAWLHTQANPNTSSEFKHYKHQLKTIDQTRRQLKQSVRNESAVEGLFLALQQAH